MRSGGRVSWYIALLFTVIATSGNTAERLNFVLAGQSNMSGRGVLSELPRFERAHRVHVFSNAWHWQNPAREPLDDAADQAGKANGGAGGAGPSLAFADHLSKLLPQAEIGLVLCAKGGSSIFDWTPAVSRSSLFGSCVARASEAGKQGHLAGLIWYQGETDAMTEEDARTWSSRFRVLLAAFRSSLSAPQLPVVVTVLGPNPNQERFGWWDIVQQQQLAMGLSSDGSVAIVSANDLPVQKNSPVHLMTEGYVALGHRYGDAMYELLKP